MLIQLIIVVMGMIFLVYVSLVSIWVLGFRSFSICTLRYFAQSGSNLYTHEAAVQGSDYLKYIQLLVDFITIFYIFHPCTFSSCFCNSLILQVKNKFTNEMAINGRIHMALIYRIRTRIKESDKCMGNLEGIERVEGQTKMKR